MGPIRLLTAPVGSILRFPLFQLAIVVAVILLLQAGDDNSARGQMFNGLDKLVESTVGLVSATFNVKSFTRSWLTTGFWIAYVYLACLVILVLLRLAITRMTDFVGRTNLFYLRNAIARERGIAAYRAWVPFERIRPINVQQEKWEEAFAWPANNDAGAPDFASSDKLFGRIPSRCHTVSTFYSLPGSHLAGRTDENVAANCAAIRSAGRTRSRCVSVVKMHSAEVNLRELLCPACRRATAHRFLFSKNGCDILQCSECGLGRVHASDAFNPRDYYTKDYFSGAHPDGYADYRGAEPVLRREFANTVSFIRKYRKNGRLLDVGCAYGFFLQEAQPYFDVTGIEIAEEAATFCRIQGLRVSQGVADSSNFAKLGMMDVITLLDVLEHLPSPYETLTLCTRYLSPGGIILITTGDFASYFAKIAGPRWRLMTPPQHLWYFTLESIQRMSRALRLHIEFYDHPWKIVPISLIAFQMRRMLGMRNTGTSFASGVGLPVNLFDALRIVLRKSN